MEAAKILDNREKQLALALATRRKKLETARENREEVKA